MEAMGYLRKKAETIAEKSLAGVSDAIYATGSIVGKGGSKVTSFLTSSAGAVGSGIYEQCCDLVAAAGNMTKVREVLDNEEFEDIMEAEEQEDDKKIKMNAREALDKASAEGKKMVGVCSKKELGQLDTMLPLNRSTDVWREAQPVTKITDSLYPFDVDGSRPTSDKLDQVYKVALGVLLNPVNKECQEELEPYVIQMFGKSTEIHEGAKANIAMDKTPFATDFKLNLILVRGRDMISQESSGKSDPYCFITIVKSEHVDMISSAKPDVVKINETKRLGMKIEKSLIIPKTLNPTWNQPYIMPLGKDGKSDMILIEVWDGDVTTMKLKDATNRFMGRAFMPLSDISLTERENTLTLYTRNKNKPLGEVTIRVNLIAEMPPVDVAKVLKDHSLLTATVLDFESHMSGSYVARWNTKITPLGYKLLSLNAGMNGITPLQQASVLFPLLQLYDKHVNLSIIGYFGVVRTISLHQDQLPASPTGSRAKIEKEAKSYPEWVQIIFSCLNKLDVTLLGSLSSHNHLFNFGTENGISYLDVNVQLFKEMYTIAPHVERLEDSRKSMHATVLVSCQKACMQWFGTIVSASTLVAADRLQEPDKGDKKRLLCFLEVTDHIIQCLNNAKGVQVIYEEIGIDYYTLLFKVVDEQVSAYVQDYTTNCTSKGGIPTYQLYLHLSDILKLAMTIPSKNKKALVINEYHEWFKNLVGDWIDVAASKCNLEVKRAVTALDEVVTVTENVKFSQSALSAAACFKRIAAFWNNLNYPNLSEEYLEKVVDCVAMAARFYVEESHKHLKSKEFHQSTGSEFIVTQQLCISLNDIEYVREEFTNIPQILHIYSPTTETDATEQKFPEHLIDKINNAERDIKFLYDQVISSVGEQISSDVNAHIKEIVQKDHKADLVEVIDPLMQYLVKNMGTFHGALLVPVLEVMLEEIWSGTVHCFAQAVKTRLGQKNARRLMEAIAELTSFFHAGGDGISPEKMNSDEYKKTCETLGLQGSTDDELIGRHLKCLAKCSRSGDKDNGVLSFSVGYIQDKQTLEITVIKGTDLPAMDSDGFSDPYVQLLLMPERKLKIKAVKTDYKNKELNPTYYKEFKIKVKENLLDMSGSVLALTVYDHDYLSRDDFIGMVVIDGAEIPRLPGSISDIDDPNAPQRKTYELPLVVDTMTPALRELAERNHQYVNDFNLYYSRGSSVAGNVVSTVTGSLARAFTVKH